MSTPAELVAEINALVGGNAMCLGNDPSLEVTYWPTGVLPIDRLLGGGLPVGRFVEIYGDYSTLKSFVALKAIAAVQKAGGTVALVDTEHAFDPVWATGAGVHVDSLLLQQPHTAEDGVKAMEVLIRGRTDLVVWDSIAASQPKQYQEAAPGSDLAPAGLARVMSNALRRLTSANSHTAILALNQTRINVGMTWGGTNEAVPGGKAMPFYASYRVRLTKAGKLSEDVKTWDGEKWITTKKTLGFKIKASLEKSKLSRPFQETWFVFDLAKGSVDEDRYLIAQALELGLFVENGSYFDIPGIIDKPLYGRPRFLKYLEDNPEVLEWVKEQTAVEPRGLATPASLGKTPPANKKAGKQKAKSSGA